MITPHHSNDQPTDKDFLVVDPIITRLKDVQHRIGEMCSKGTPPRMSIPARPEIDDDIVISRTCDAAIESITNWQARAEKAEAEVMRLEDKMRGSRMIQELSASQAEIRRLREARDWQPIETAPKDQEVTFWIRPKVLGDHGVYADTSGNTILLKDGPGRLHHGKFGTWSSLTKATHWMPLPLSPAEKGGEG